MITYFNGSFLPLEEVHISPFDRGFQFADGVYEALITYNGKLFLFNEHLKRLKRSLNEIKLKYDELENLEEIMYELIKRNGLNDAVIYIQVTRGAKAPRMHIFPPDDVKPTIFISASDVKSNPDEVSNGVKVILEKDIRWGRCDIKSIMLLPSAMAKQNAAENNAYEAVWVRDGLLKEGAHTNIFIVKQGNVITPPLSNTILPGVTRQFVIDLCKKNNISIIEREIESSEMTEIDEFFITGTTTEVKPVVKINDMLIRSGKPGRVTKSIQDLFRVSIEM